MTARARARQVYQIGIYVVVAAVVIQFLLAGLGIFTNGDFLFYHAAINGAIIFFLPLILVGIGWYAGMDRRTLGMTAGIAGLVIVQSLLLFPYHTDVQGPLRAISGFHALNALLIFWLALRLMDRVRYPRTASQVPPVSTS